MSGDQRRSATAPRPFAIPNKTARRSVSIPEIPWRKIGIYVVLSIGFFLLGAVPMWLRVREKAGDLVVVQRELGLSRMTNSLSESVIDARRGNYEPARQTASDFFTALRHQVDNEGTQVVSINQRESLKSLLTQRDDIITLLARGDSAAADRLSDFYVAYRKIMSGAQTSNSTTK